MKKCCNQEHSRCAIHFFWSILGAVGIWLLGFTMGRFIGQ